MAKINITDISNDFTSNPVTGDISVKKDLDAIKQSLRNLLLLSKFDKPFKPQIDVGLQDLLFENFPDPVFQTIISQKINYIISEYEPRVEVQKVEVENRYEDNLMTIDITFTLKNEKQATPQNLQINLERNR
jgi:phage baseplate assembly protein W